MAKTTILGIFDHAEDARHALNELRDSGLELYDTSLVAQGEGDTLSAPEGAAVGAAWGGLVGLVALAIPGIGPFIAGGALVAGLTGAAAGAVVGGIGGALAQNNNLSPEASERYAGAVQQGKTLIVVQAEDTHAVEVRRILARDGANSIRENQTDMLHGGAIAVDMYDEGGAKIEAAHGGVVDVERRADSVNVSSLFSSQGSLVGDNQSADRDADFDTQLPATSGASGDASDFESEDRRASSTTGTPMANGARVVSYEDAEQPVQPNDQPKNVPLP
ncbi:MAG: hypothetical protein H7Z42_01570 [Roseiflexaceae bacterium]|nr:hypothetical protein [Roseiflexaceae bacterium]